MQFDICYIVSHGFSSRMIMQTDLLGKLVAKGKKVAIITPKKSDDSLLEYCSKNKVSIFEFDQKSTFQSENYIFKRKYFLENLEENPALLEKHIYAVRYNTSKHPLRIIRPYYYYFLYSLIKYFPGIRERFARKESKFFQSKDAHDLIAKINPAKLISLYPVNFIEASLLYAGNRQKGVETWIQLLSWDNITCKGHFPVLAEKYIAWGKIMNEELLEYYNIQAENISICGVPHFDLHVDVQRKPEPDDYLKDLGIDASKRYLFFAMSSPRFAPFEIEIVEWLANRIIEGEWNDLQLIIRPHPQNVQGNMSDLSWLPRLDKLNTLKGVGVDYPSMNKDGLNWSMQNSDMVKLANLIAGSAVTLNSGSTICIDAMMQNKPVILTSFDGIHNVDYWKSAKRLKDFTHLHKLISLGGISISNNYEELAKLIQLYLSDKFYLVDERKKTIEMQCLDNNGKATDRVVDVLIKS